MDRIGSVRGLVIISFAHVPTRYHAGIAGIEFVEDDDGQLYVYDVNACNTNYNTDAEARAGLAFADTGPGRVALYLQREMPAPA